MIVAHLIFYLTVLSYFVCLWKIFEKTNLPKWAGFVPVVNLFYLIKLIEKPWWWILLMIVPGVNFLMLIVIHVELARSFGKRKTTDYLLAIFLPFVTIGQLAFKADEKHVGLPDYKTEKKTKSREWTEAIIFAVVAATIIRTFFIEAFTIPTPSMEKSLLVGDYLFVSKVSYGARLPMTPISFPLTHHTIPVINAKSYVEWQKLPYKRLPGLGDVERFDATVFNYPEGDTVIVNVQDVSYYQYVREYGWKNIHNENFKVRSSDRRMVRTGGLTVRPIDKRENYIKRTIGLPGESISIKGTQVYIDGEAIENPENYQFYYFVYAKSPLSEQVLDERYGVKLTEQDKRDFVKHKTYVLPLTPAQYDAFNNMSSVDSVVIYKKRPQGDYHIFPNHPSYSWTEDDFGPLWIPKAGETIDLTLENLPLYERAIDVYEDNDLEVKGNDIYINGELATSYTFKQDYYFMMGDNRHNSADSRFWGFVPYDHIVGKAVFIWFSKEYGGSIRWDRLFSLVD